MISKTTDTLKCFEILDRKGFNVPLYDFKAYANGCNIVGQQNCHNIVEPKMLRPFAWNRNNVALVAYSLKPVKRLVQQVLTFLLFCNRRSVAQFMLRLFAQNHNNLLTS